MTPSLLGVLAAVALATGLWLAGRRPRPLLKSTDTREVAALNRAQNTLVWEARQALPAASLAADGPGQGEGADAEGGWAPRIPLAALPAARLSALERQAWLQELHRHYAAGGRQRLAALRGARAWGQREVLPLLRRGLRDADPAVVREAALAMEAFRGRPGPLALRELPGPAAQPFRPEQPFRLDPPFRVDQPARPAQAPAAPRKVARTR
jgi:hypothetical protein